MSKIWSSPVGVGYPVNFCSGGDTTRDAFGKHIQEIERIYGMLNALDAGKVGASDVSGSIGSVNSSLTSSLTAHINSSNPHPNWKPSVSWNDLTNKPSLSALSGNLDTSRISGLTSLIDSRIPAASGDGITSGSLNDNGYVKFKNGLIIQWGTVHYVSGYPCYYKFHTAFPNSCFAMSCQGHTKNSSLVDWTRKVGEQSEYSRVLLYDWDTEGFIAIVQLYGGVETDGNAVYIAIGK